MSFTWRHDSSLLHVITGLFIVNGVAAIGAHWSGMRAWHNVDAKSMLLAVWLALGYLMAELFENTFRRLDMWGPKATCVRSFANAFTWATVLWVYWWIAEMNMRLGSYLELGRL